jgi:AcrR family transcriptional regulator
MNDPAAPATTRRTQAERSQATRERLMAATIECLMEEGYAGATTARIESRAGVSRGARLHHFPSKTDLLVAAVEHLYLGLREDFESRFKQAVQERSLPEGDRFLGSFQLLWSNFKDPRHAAVLELFVLARADDALRDRLRDVTAEHHAHMQRRARAYFPDAGSELVELVPAILESIHAALEGLALRRVLFGEDQTERLVIDTVEEMARQLILSRIRATD